MIDITGEISQLLKNKKVNLRSDEYLYLKEKYYSAKYQVKSLQNLLNSEQQRIG